MFPKLETERLVLRIPTSADFPTYEAFYRDKEASHFYGGPLPAHRAWGILAADLGHWQLRGYGRWVIETKLDGVMVGGCGLWWPEGWPRSELTWWITPSARRKGFAKEASRAVIEFAYDKLKWALVETHMDDSNEAARRLVLSLGGEILMRDKFPDGKERNVYALQRKPVSDT